MLTSCNIDLVLILGVYPTLEILEIRVKIQKISILT